MRVVTAVSSCRLGSEAARRPDPARQHGCAGRRCRHAHCLITGPGWLAFGAFALVEAGLGRSLIAGYEQPVFLGILAVAVTFEISWYLARRTNAITSHPT